MSSTSIANPGEGLEQHLKRTEETETLHRQGLEHLQAGEWSAAVDTLEELVKRHPDSEYYADLLEEARLKVKLDKDPPRRQSSHNLLRSRRVWILTIINLLFWGALFGQRLYAQQIAPALQQRQSVSRQQELLNEGRQLLVAGDLEEAKARFEAVLDLDPDNTTAQNALDEINRRQQLNSAYQAAMAHIEQEDWASALEELESIRREEPGFRDVQAQIERVRELQQRSSDLDEARQLFEAGNWQAAIDQLQQLRQEAPDFKPDAVTGLLSKSYAKQAEAALSNLGRSSIEEQIDQLEEAISLFESALETDASNENAATQLELAQAYLAGLTAYQDQDWESASRHLDKVWEREAGYADGRAAELLERVYVREAEAALADLGQRAIDEQIDKLQQVIKSFDAALGVNPANEEAETQSELAKEYLAGLHAYQQASWESAGVHLGNVYMQAPGYADGQAAELLQITYVNSGNRYLRIEKHKRAAERYRQAIALGLVRDSDLLSEDGRGELESGDRLVRQQEYQQAILKYGEVLSSMGLEELTETIDAVREELARQPTPTPATTPEPTPAPTSTYVVRPNDTLTEIAQRFNTTVGALLEANDMIWDRNLIRPGWELVIPQS